jgi:hypothetical protein
VGRNVQEGKVREEWGWKLSRMVGPLVWESVGRFLYRGSWLDRGARVFSSAVSYFLFTSIILLPCPPVRSPPYSRLLHTRSFHLTELPPPAHRQAPHVVDFVHNIHIHHCASLDVITNLRYARTAHRALDHRPARPVRHRP